MYQNCPKGLITESDQNECNYRIRPDCWPCNCIAAIASILRCQADCYVKVGKTVAPGGWGRGEPWDHLQAECCGVFIFARLKPQW